MPPIAYRTALSNRVDRLFHYQRYSSEHLRRALNDRIIQFTRASTFNDPWDCKPSFYVPNDQADLLRLVEFMHGASERHTPAFDRDERAARAAHYLQNPDQLRRDLAEASAEMWAQMDRRYRMYCLSTKPDNPLMWGHYADHHRGICLEFDAHKPDFSSALQVSYSTEYPRFSLDAGADLSPFLSKSSDWTYEEEYRLIAQEESEALVAGTLMTHDGIYQYSRGALVSVIIGSGVPEATINAIVSVAHATGVIVRKASRVADRYALRIDPPFQK